MILREEVVGGDIKGVGVGGDAKGGVLAVT